MRGKLIIPFQIDAHGTYCKMGIITDEIPKTNDFNLSLILRIIYITINGVEFNFSAFFNELH